MKRALIALLCLFLLAAPAAAAGGDGTAANPYRIETAAELQSIQNDLSAHYLLVSDIDLTGVTWTPIGSTSAGFFGEVDGGGHTISNLSLSATTQSAGLFRSLTSGATIKDLTLADCHVTSTASWCGTLAGSIIMSDSEHETATLQNIELVRCSATSASSHVANIVGLIFTAAVVDIIDCTVSNSIAESTASGAVANIVGGCNGASSTYIVGATVEYSHAKATSNYIANIVGGCNGASSTSVEDTTVSNSIAKAAASYVGGIFGVVLDSGSGISASGCVVQDCTIVATGNYAGGIAGRIVSGSTGVFTNNTVSGCSILANAYAAGVCPAYS